MAEKRPAQEDSFGTSQLVKRQKSNADLGNESAVAVVNDSAKNGALIQPVRFVPGHQEEWKETISLAEIEKIDCSVDISGSAHEWPRCPDYGTDRCVRAGAI